MSIEDFKKDNNWFTRLIIERDELQKKVEALKVYIESEAFTKLSQHHQDLLDLQFNSMVQYFGILVMRINIVVTDNKLTA